MSRWKEYQEKKAKQPRVSPFDFLKPSTSYASDPIAEARYAVCLECPELIELTKQCKKCGCFMHLKTKLEKATCPLGKW